MFSVAFIARLWRLTAIVRGLWRMLRRAFA